MRVVMTGGHGFLGWHTACRLRAMHGVDARRLSRAELHDPDRLEAAVDEADVVIHLAGVNRAATDDEVVSGNLELADRLVAALRAARHPPSSVVFSNSVQSLQDTAYGRSKAEAARRLARAVHEAGGSFVDVVLPNLFGEHGRPAYNSFVATFCAAVVAGESPAVNTDAQVPLLHVQRAAEVLVRAALGGDGDDVLVPPGEPWSVAAVLDLVHEFHSLYQHGEVPALDDPFRVDLFNTYRSYAFPAQFPLLPTVHSDTRGDLFETVRSHGGTGQAFVSTTRPGQTRGDHYHFSKFERFFVVSGEAEIQLRRLLHQDVVTFRLSGDRPAFVDMPTLWVHNITNVGTQELITMFWSDQLLDLTNPDQYPEKVEQETAP